MTLLNNINSACNFGFIFSERLILSEQISYCTNLAILVFVNFDAFVRILIWK